MVPCHNPPERYGPWKIVYSRFQTWVRSGLFEQSFDELIDNPDMGNLSLDSTIVRAHQKATGTENTECVVIKSSYRTKSLQFASCLSSFSDRPSSHL